MNASSARLPPARQALLLSCQFSERRHLQSGGTAVLLVPRLDDRASQVRISALLQVVPKRYGPWETVYGLLRFGSATAPGTASSSNCRHDKLAVRYEATAVVAAFNEWL